MLYYLSSDVYLRKYGKLGLIIRKPLSLEKAVDEIGYIFLSQLSYEPKKIEEILKSLLLIFVDADNTEIKRDAIEFYNQFVKLQLIKCDSFSNENYIDANEKKSLVENKYSAHDFDANFFLDIVHIELTKKCNERCIHCYIPHSEKNIEIDCNFMINILEQCRDMGVVTVMFSGGEPLLHPHFSEFLKKAKDLDLYVEIYTNLTLLTDEIIFWLKYRHTTSVKVSLYSMNAKVHDKITTVSGTFETTKKNILKLLEADIPVTINCTVLKQNMDSYDEVIKWGKKHGCPVVVDYQIIAKTDKNVDNLCNRITTIDLEHILKKMISNKENLHESQKYMFQKEMNAIDLEGNICSAGTNLLAVEADGKVYPCVGWHYLCGDLCKSTLEEIWNYSQQLFELRKIHKKDFYRCSSCEDKDYCQRCIARNYNESNGNIFDIPQITCDAARIQHKVIEEYRKKFQE